RLQGERVRYVKPHGALYNTAAIDVYQATAVVGAILDYDRTLPVLCLPGSVLGAAAAAAGIRVVGEGFADRAYRPDGLLVPRTEPGAVVSNVDTVVARAVAFAELGLVEAIDGSSVAATVESLCVHGDTPGAVDLAQRVRAGLGAAGIDVAPFVALR